MNEKNTEADPVSISNTDIAADTSQPLLLSTLSDAGVLTLTLNRPDQFNALSEAMLDALQSAVDKLSLIHI